jgi:IS605 OrfB family transposase
VIATMSWSPSWVTSTSTGISGRFPLPCSMAFIVASATAVFSRSSLRPLTLGYPQLPGRIALAEVLVALGRYREALTELEAAAAIAAEEELVTEAAPTQAARTQAALNQAARTQAGIEHKLADVHHRLGDWELAEAHLAVVTELVEGTEPGRLARAQADRAVVAYRAAPPGRPSRELPGPPSSVTVIRDAAGRFFASFVVVVAAAPLPPTGAECGIDLGLYYFAVLDDGTKVAAPRFLRRAEKKLRRAHKDLSRTKKGSGNREKARMQVARAHAKVADARRDFHHKLSTAIIRDNQAVTVEDLAVKGLSRTRLAKSVHDAGWSAFISMLEYKARLYGRELTMVGRFEPTSQLCSECGVRDGPKPLHVRQWQCSACGAVHDRDVNAARNILALGRRERLNARGGDIRPPLAVAVAGEAGSRRGAA